MSLSGSYYCIIYVIVCNVEDKFNLESISALSKFEFFSFFFRSKDVEASAFFFSFAIRWVIKLGIIYEKWTLSFVFVTEKDTLPIMCFESSA